MLLLNPIVRKTSEKRSRWWTRLAGFGLWSVLQPICMSLNIRSIKEEHDDVYTAPFLVALWHNRTMVPGYAWPYAGILAWVPSGDLPDGGGLWPTWK